MKSNFQAKTKHWVNFRRFSESPPPCFGKICYNFFVSVIFCASTNLRGHCGLVTLSLFYIAILDKGTTFHSTFLWKLSWSELFWVENYPRRKTDVADYFAWKTHKSLAENAQKVNRLPFLKCRISFYGILIAFTTIIMALEKRKKSFWEFLHILLSGSPEKLCLKCNNF